MLRLCALAILAVAPTPVFAEDKPVGGQKKFTSLNDFDDKWCKAGEVVAIAENFIVIKELELKGFPQTSYRFHQYLAKGEYLPCAHDATAYVPSDVKIGDLVSVHGYKDKDKIDGEVYAVTLKICMRGGVVRPSAIPNKKYPYHEWANYRQKWELEGIPMPEEYVKERYDGVHPPPPKAKPLREPDKK